jgi:hypothetical protein
MRFKQLTSAVAALLVAPAMALAQPVTDDDAVDWDSDEPGGPLPEPRSSDDPQPPVAMPGTPTGMVVKQAGVGGPVGYGRAGVLELGGSAGFTATGDFTQINITPSIGWFVADNLQLSGRLGFTYVAADDAAGNRQDGSMTSLLVEPSYHFPFNRTTFAFAGIGVGGAYASGPGLGFAMAPRIGGNFLVGRSGILTPALSWQYTTHEAMDTELGTLLVVSSAVMANIGYTVMW